MNSIKDTTQLITIPSFFRGMSRVADLFGNLDTYKYTKNADTEALKNDWKNVGNDMRTVIKENDRGNSRRNESSK